MEIQNKNLDSAMQRNKGAERHIEDNQEKNCCSETGVKNQRKNIYMRV